MVRDLQFDFDRARGAFDFDRRKGGTRLYSKERAKTGQQLSVKKAGCKLGKE